MADHTVVAIDAFRKIDGNWCCPLASSMTSLTNGIALILFTASRNNAGYWNLIDSVRSTMANPPPLLVLNASDQSCRPLLTQMSLSPQSLPQLFVTDLTGIITPMSTYNGHRVTEGLLNYLLEQQQLSITKYSPNRQLTVGSSVEQSQAKSAV